MEPTADTNEFKKPLFLFEDWKPYQGEKLVVELKRRYGITYTPPKKLPQLREEITKKSKNFDDTEASCVSIFLSWLEKGMMQDKHEKNEKARNEELLNNTITIGNKEVTLYELSKKVNKLAANPITGVLGSILVLASLKKNTYTGDQGVMLDTLGQESKNLMKKIKEISQNRGYFVPEDLESLDELAKKALSLILGIEPEEINHLVLNQKSLIKC
jgi:hypothetical protein